MTGTFTPAPGAAPLRQQVAAQTAMEARLLLRNGEQLLLALVIPVLVLVGGVAGTDRLGLSLSRTAVDEQFVEIVARLVDVHRRAEWLAALYDEPPA